MVIQQARSLSPFSSPIIKQAISPFSSPSRISVRPSGGASPRMTAEQYRYELTKRGVQGAQLQQLLRFFATTGNPMIPAPEQIEKPVSVRPTDKPQIREVDRKVEEIAGATVSTGTLVPKDKNFWEKRRVFIEFTFIRDNGQRLEK